MHSVLLDDFNCSEYSWAAAQEQHQQREGVEENKQQLQKVCNDGTGREKVS